MEWVIYKHTNKFNGKVYIGQTHQKPTDRWQNGRGYEHNPYFYNAIIKYGWNEGFTHEIIERGILSQEEANEKEIAWIAFYNSYEEGYNLTKGGDNHDHLGTEVYQIDKNTLQIIEKFPTLRAAANSIKGDHTYIAKCCSGQSVSGYDSYWCFVEDWNENWQPRETKDKTEFSNRKPVFQIDMDTLQIIQEYKSASDAERLSNGKFHSSLISQCCNRTKYCSTGGFYWCFIEDWSEDWTPRVDKNKLRQRKVEREDGLVFNSATEAANFSNIKYPETILRCCNGKQKTAGGFHWKYTE